jgi:amidohydrolase
MPQHDTASFDHIVGNGVRMRHELHRHPEVAWHETWTAAYVRRELDRLGIPWRACAGTGTVGTLAGGAMGEHRALRADIDGLPIAEATSLPYASIEPGRMHACGHDGHTASLLAAAAWLKQHEGKLPGPVTLLFQPAEEGGFGAKKMIDEGALDGVQRIFGYHNWPPIPFGRAACGDGTVLGSNARFSITITGRGGHASQPEACRDPVAAGALFVTAVQQIVSRRVAPQQAAVVSVTIFQAGDTGNIIPDHAVLGGTVRALTVELRDELARQVEAVLQATCAASAVQGQFDYEPNYPATINEAGSAALGRAALQSLLGPECLWSASVPIMGAEDFSYYLEQVPGAFLLLGTGRVGRPLEPCHSPRFDYDDGLMPVVVRLWAKLVGAPDPAVAVT